MSKKEHTSGKMADKLYICLSGYKLKTMKHIISMMAAAVLCAAAFSLAASVKKDKTSIAGTDAQGHELVRLWSDYKGFKEKDRPREATDVLREIISQARKKHLPWDFYDGWINYIEEASSVNWKWRDSLRAEMDASARRFSEPLVDFRIAADRMHGDSFYTYTAGFLKENAGILKTGRHQSFYKSGYGWYLSSFSSGLPDFVTGSIPDDYAYVLWVAASRSRFRGDMVRELSDYIGGSYPDGAYLEYLKAASSDDNGRSLAAFAGKYDGKAIALYARQSLLRERMDSLLIADAPESEFIFMRELCGRFEKDRASFGGTEKKIASGCSAVAGIIGDLDGSKINISDKDGKIAVALRNLEDAVLSIMKGDEVIYRKALSNDRNSYYVYDTLYVDIPVLDDGSYSVSCVSGDVVSHSQLDHYSLSMAVRKDSDGMASVYVTDYKTGEPVEKADVDVMKGDSIVYAVQGLELDGFTPAGFSLNEDVVYVKSSFRDKDGRLRSSKARSMYQYRGEMPDDPEMRVYCDVFKDRGAFNPGDTLKFKAVLYTYADGVHAPLPEGTEVRAIVSDPREESLAELVLKCNGTGSVSGAMPLPSSGYVNGMFSIRIIYGEETVGSSYFIVDDFVLPTYDLSFIPVSDLYFPGDAIEVKGRVENYTGHPLSSASVSYSVSDFDGVIKEGILELSGDGEFAIDFVSGKAPWTSYTVKVKITDATGETAEFYDYVPVSGDFSITAELAEPCDGMVLPAAWRNRGWHSRMTSIMSGDKALLTLRVMNAGYICVPLEKIPYDVYRDGDRIFSGTALSGKEFCIDLSGYPSGTYRVDASYAAGGRTYSYEYNLVKMHDADTAAPSGIDAVFKVVEGDGASMQIGTGDKPMWAVVELWGGETGLLKSEIIFIDKNAVRTVRYGFEDRFPESVRMYVFYFRDGDNYSYYADYERETSVEDNLFLEFSSFADKSNTSEECIFELKTEPGAECLVSVFDKSTERIFPNMWSAIRKSSFSGMPYIDVTAVNGGIKCRPPYLNTMHSKSFVAADEVVEATVAGPPAARDNVTAEMNLPSDAGGYGNVREYFANTLAFYPDLRSDADGKVSFAVKASDKASTYIVSVMAYDKSLNSKVVRRETVVTRPVLVSVMEPQYLYEGDMYSLRCSVSNISEQDAEGMLTMYLYDGADYRDEVPLMVSSVPLDVKKDGSEEAGFDIRVPSGADTLGVRLVYAAPGVSDGVFVTVPVLPGCQVLTEAHSDVLLSGMDRDSLISDLGERFVNTFPEGAEVSERSLMELVWDAVPDSAGFPDANDVISLTGSLYASRLSGLVRNGGTWPASEKEEALLSRILNCAASGGGFGWFGGMKPSAVVTAFVLGQFAGMPGMELPDDVVRKSVGYLDRSMFSEMKGASGVYSGLSMSQYLYIRSMYPYVPFAAEPDKKELAVFRKEVKCYFNDMLDGYILGKVRRGLTVLNLLSADSEDLIKVWGVRYRHLVRILKGETLQEYAVRHASGAVYFPNAVMPFRGLLESELYAHVMLCDYFTAYSEYSGSADAERIADGIRLWMMLQKDTQSWSDAPAFMDAVRTVLDTSSDILDTRIVTLRKSYIRPFDEIKASGNGMRIVRKYYKVSGDRIYSGQTMEKKELQPGDILNVGDKIIGEYEVWSEENRSFVKVALPRHAALRPVEQLSGNIGWWLRPLTVGGTAIYPQGYREVKASETVYYFDVLPEEATVITEEFYVSQAGLFNAPAAWTESVYAPHYRANDKFSEKIFAE